MKRVVSSITITLLFLALATLAWGALPQTINYQGYLKNTDGTPVNSAVSVVFSLYLASSGGSGALWTETRSVTPANGVYSVQLGSGTALPPSLFANDTLWLGVKVGPTDPEMTPRQQLTMAPYAYRAGTADSVAAGGVGTTAIYDGAVTFAKLASNGCSSGQIIRSNGSSWECAAPVSSGGTLQGQVSACTRTLLYIAGRGFMTYLPGSGTATPASGNFTFDRVPAGNYTLIAENSIWTQTSNVSVAEGGVTTVPLISFWCTYTGTPGTAAVNFSVDDRINRVYQQGDLQWKGSFAMASDYATSRKVVPDPTWAGPFPVLYDDGPWPQGGHEPIGSLAGDHVWGLTLFVTTPATGSDAYSYGLVDVSSPYNGVWLWQGASGTFSVASTQDLMQPIIAQGMSFPAFGTTDVRITLDTASLASGTWDTTTVGVKSSVTSWNILTLTNDGAGKYTFTLSSVVGTGKPYPHNGLAASGDALQFVFVLGGVEYKTDGNASTLGVTAYTKASGGGSFTAVAVAVDAISHNGVINVP
jgi:hypothetical protein